jgi:hypothetical protein
MHLAYGFPASKGYEAYGVGYPSAARRRDVRVTVKERRGRRRSDAQARCNRV